MSRSLLGTYLRFLRSPNLTDPPIAISTFKAAKSILRLYSLHLLLLLVVLALINQIPSAQESNNLLDILEGTSVWYLPMMAVVVAPLLEECLFRLPLRAFAVNLLLPASLILFGGTAIEAYGVLSTVGWRAIASAPVVICAIVAFINVYFGLKRTKLSGLQAFYNKYSRIVFYSVALLFGAIHIFNYDANVWLFLPVLVLPQVIIGLLFGFVRLRYGFNWALLLHAFHNGIVLLPVVLVQLFGSEQLQANLTEPPSLDALSQSDLVVTSVTSFYSIVGILLCGVVAWKLIREWSDRQTRL